MQLVCKSHRDGARHSQCHAMGEVVFDQTRPSCLATPNSCCMDGSASCACAQEQRANYSNV